MTRADAHAWLRTRRPERPAALAARMTVLVDAVDGAALEEVATMAEAMALIGVDLLARVAGSADPQAKGLALDLLAADAFVTYAFEAAAEDDVDVGPMVRRLLTEVG